MYGIEELHLDAVRNAGNPVHKVTRRTSQSFTEESHAREPYLISNFVLLTDILVAADSSMNQCEFSLRRCDELCWILRWILFAFQNMILGFMPYFLQGEECNVMCLINQWCW